MNLLNDIYIGIDLSFTGTGICILDNNSNLLENKTISTPSSETIENRILFIENKILKIIEKYQKENNILNIAIEGLSFQSKGQFILQLAALHYYIRISLLKKNIDYKIFPPQEIKKFLTGKGNSKKEIIILNIYKKWNVEFGNNNEADAFAIGKYLYFKKENEKIEK